MSTPGHEGPGPAPDTALARALAFLLREAPAGFPETRHRMQFPRWAGFTGAADEHSGDVFARAVLAGVLLDIGDVADDPIAAAMRAIARAEAGYVARARLAHRRGGWSYFPALPELPPDLDSLAAAATLFARAAPDLRALCEEPLAVALGQQLPTGAIATWLVSFDDAQAERDVMARGIAQCWGAGADIDVCARFFRALLWYDEDRYRREIASGLAFIQAAQQAHGGWSSTWYFGEVYGNGLCIEFLRAASMSGPALERGIERIAALQHADGGWGPKRSYALDTAVAVWLLARGGDAGHRPRVARGRACLLDLQTAEGFWEGTPWIAMNTGRARGDPGPLITHRSTTLTTALCVRALFAAGS